MDWNTIAIVLVTVVFTRLYLYFKERLDKPYRWKCPDPNCFFAMKLNDSELLTKMADDHVHKFHTHIKEN